MQIDFDGQQYYVTPGAVPGPDANAAGPDAPFVRTDLATIRIDSAVIRTDSAAVVWGALYQKQGRGVFGFVEEEGRGLVEPRVAAGWEEVPGFSYGTRQTLPLSFMPLPVLMWCAMRMAPRMTAPRQMTAA